MRYGQIASPCRMSGVEPSDREPFVVAAKGAPEAIAELCRLNADVRAELKKSVDQMAAAGLRVLGVARATFAGQPLPETQHGFDFSFVGLVGLSDPLRGSVPAAIRECRTAGIRVVMITGDYPATARAVARAAGLDGDDIVSGEQLGGRSPITTWRYGLELRRFSRASCPSRSCESSKR